MAEPRDAMQRFYRCYDIPPDDRSSVFVFGERDRPWLEFSGYSTSGMR